MNISMFRQYLKSMRDNKDVRVDHYHNGVQSVYRFSTPYRIEVWERVHNDYVLKETQRHE